MLFASSGGKVIQGDVFSLWTQFVNAWETGGLAFLLFVALLLFFTGRVVSGRDRDRIIKDWETRYKENDERWRERYAEQKSRADSAEHTLYQLMGYQARTVTVAERTSAAAEVAATVAAGQVPPKAPG